MPTTRMPSNPTSRSLRLGRLAAVLGLFAALAQESLLAGATNSFFQNAATQTQGNYSTGSAPNNTNAYSGADTVTLAGSSAHTFTGITTVSEETLQLNKTAAADAIAGDIEVNSDAFLRLSASGNVDETAAVTLSGGTILRGGNVSETFGNLDVTHASLLDFGADNAVGDGFTTGTEGGNFSITAIPEPSTYLAAAGLLGLMLWPSRKRLIKDAKKILGITPPMRDRLAARSKA
jgi:autotransporter-associated beta strand protein